MKEMNLFGRGPTKGQPLAADDVIECSHKYVCNKNLSYVSRDEEVEVVYALRSKITFTTGHGQYSCTPSDFRKYFSKL